MDEQQARQMRAFQKEYDEMELPVVSMSPAREELDLRMSDGVCLQTILFLPRPDARSCGRSWPVIVQRSPYASSLPLYEFHGRNLACHGFIYIIQFCRGTGESGGEWIPNVNERRDGLDTMAWLQKADWAGRVGFWGASYMALTGWCMADAVPDKVKGMFLSVYGTDRFASAYCKGSFRHDVLTSWAMENAGFPVSADYMESYRYRPQIEVDQKLWGREIPWYREWISSPDEEDPYWQQGFWRQLREIPGKLRIPVYISEGWYDHHLGSALKSYAAIKEEEKERCTLQIGCWNHMKQNCLEWAQPEDLRSSEIKPMTDWFTSLLVKETIMAKTKTREEDSRPVIKTKLSASSKVFYAICYTFVTIVAVICLVPFIILVSSSFTSEDYIRHYGYGLIPHDFSLAAYEMIFKTPMTVLRAYGVSIFITVVGTVCGTLIITLAAYVISRKDFKYRNQVSFFFYFTTLFNGGMVCTYIFYIQYLHLKDSLLALILPGIFQVFYMLVMRSFVSAIPSSLIESAKIDGAGEWRTFFQVVFPLLKAGLATIALFLALGYWNDWYNAMLYINTEEKYPLQYMLYNLLQQSQAISRIAAQAGISVADMPSNSLKMAMAVVATGPILLVYPFVQKYFVAGITVGSVKG